MKIIRINNLKEINYIDNLSIALGYFDSLHLGHFALIKELLHSPLKKAVLTFSINPKSYVKKEEEKNILDVNTKISFLNSLGIDYVLILETSYELLSSSKDEFIDFLINIGAKEIICGFDYRFGKFGQGSAYDLKDNPHFKVEIIERITDSKEEKVSSTLIKEILKNGDIERANALLVPHYKLRGKTIKGFGKGKVLGHSTANVKIEDNIYLPRLGVYAVKAEIEGQIYKGMANLGYHPSINELDKPLLEINIFDFNQDIYGEDIIIYPIKYIREERKFNSLEELIKQLDKDEIEIREILK